MKCTITGCRFETTSPLGMRSHSTGHRNDFETKVGRPPEDYNEVRDFFGGDLEITTLDDYQTTLPTHS